MISRDSIETILSACKIEEVIGDFVSLRRRGVNLIGLCPFHNEKTPSFTVSPVKGIYKCFGCGKAGNSVNFVMEHEHVTYPEALRYLAKKYMIDLEEEIQTPEAQQEHNEKESLFVLNHFANEFFIKTLHETEEGKAIALSYLRERKIRDDIIQKFQLGYSPEKWDLLTTYAIKHGYKQEHLIKSGLTIQKDQRFYDRFHSRVIFPVHSVSGRIIGFGGRILTSEKNRPKYINSPETDIYQKSKSLYGIFFAKNQIVSKDNCYLVEGYTDVIALHQAGIENVVASSGTSLTQDQIRLILRYTKNITILFDGDPAGIKASFRGIDMIVEEGMNVKIVLFPEGADPDSYARNHHPSEILDFITKHADNFILFKTRLLLDETQGDPIKKASLIKEMVQTISLIPEGITRSIYIRECSALMVIPEQILLNEVKKILRKKIVKSLPEIDKPEDIGWEENTRLSHLQEDLDPNSTEYQEKEIIRLLLIYGKDLMTFEINTGANTKEEISVPVADFLINDINKDDITFDHPVYQKIYQIFNDHFQKDQVAIFNQFSGHIDPEISSTAIDLVTTPHTLSSNWEKNNIFIETEENHLKKIIFSAMLSFKAKKIDRMIMENQKKIRSITSPEEQTAVISLVKDLKAKSILVNQELGRIITK